MAANPVDTIRAPARRAAREAAPWVERLARIGYVARGIVYMVVGGVAARAAFGGGGRVEGQRGALEEIFRQPFGKFILGLVALGLVGFAIWRFVQAALDPEQKGTDAKGAVTRAGYAVSGVVHTGLAIAAIGLLRGTGSGGDDGGQGLTARVLEAPAGRWLVAAAGLIVIAFGLYELYRAAKSKIGERLNLAGMSPAARDGLVIAARAGMAARGVVFALIGFFLVRAALQYDSSEARGLRGALVTLREQPAGKWLLAAVALGLVGFGIFEIVKARYRRITPA